MKDCRFTRNLTRGAAEPTATHIRVLRMRMLLRYLLIGVLVAGVSTGCGNKSGGVGDQPNPSSSSDNGGGVGGY